MKYRFAKLKDTAKIVDLHYAVRKNYPIGVFSSLDKNFLKCYYKILLNDVNSIIVCAEDSGGEILGFCSANLDVEKQLLNFKKNKFRIALSALSSIIKRPSVLKAFFSRFRSIEDGKKQFVSKSGARLEYWVWSKKSNNTTSSLYMHEVLLNIIKDLGVQEINFEVDSINRKVMKFHKLNGAIINKKIILEDNRERVLMKYVFSNREQKVKLNIL